MKKKFSIVNAALILLSFLIISPVMGQRKRGERDAGESLITQDQINKIAELVRPIKEQLEKQLSNDENYKAYVNDINELNAARSFDEKSSMTKKINEKYSTYFQKIWAAANVDEKAYQLKIRSVFPPDLNDLIKFESFLVFTLIKSEVPPAPPPTEALPPDKCIDVCSMIAGEITGTSGLIAGGGGAYGNCYVRTNAWSAVFGGNNTIFGYLRNTITIPGTFPSDSRKLRVKKTWELAQEATTFAVLGGGYAETRARVYTSSEYMLVYSPVIFGSHSIKLKTMSLNYLLEKKDVANSTFVTSANTFSVFVSGNWSYSSCNSIKWSICEEK